MRLMIRWLRYLLFAFVAFLATLCMGTAFTGSVVPMTDQVERIRAYTRPLEFDYVNWELEAIRLKLRTAWQRPQQALSPQEQHDLVLAYLDLVGQIQATEGELQRLYGDPNLSEAKRQAALQATRAQLNRLYAQRDEMGPTVEAIIQTQVSQVLAEAGLGVLGGHPFPPVLFHFSPVPMALIVSPRTVIRQDANISLRPDLPLDDQIALEDAVAQAFDVSTLVVPVGGVGVYPTMVMQTTNLPWLLETVVHEWTHNYLDWHPLGMRYNASPGLRTMNETTATIVGQELGRQVLERFYPDRVPPPPAPAPSQPPANQPPPFDFRAEMHETRVTVDRLLAEGKVEEAEAYMEQRRRFFWEHGYHIRKLNQAYFAFYGAYAAAPGGGAAGEDPVGAAVRQLRAQSPDVATFLKRMAWMWDEDDLMQAVGAAAPTLTPTPAGP